MIFITLIIISYLAIELIEFDYSVIATFLSFKSTLIPIKHIYFLMIDYLSLIYLLLCLLSQFILSTNLYLLLTTISIMFITTIIVIIVNLVNLIALFTAHKMITTFHLILIKVKNN